MLKRFGRDAVIYTAPVILSRATGLITLPLFTRYLTPHEYGAVAMVTVGFVLLSLVASLEIEQGMARSLADQQEPEQQSRIVSTAFWFQVLVFLAVAGALLLLPRVASTVLFGDDTYADLIPFVAGYMLLQACALQLVGALRWTLRPMGAALTAMCLAAGVIGVGVPLVVFLGLGIKGILIGRMAGAALAILVGVISLRETPIRSVLAVAELRTMLAFSLPLVFSNIGVYLSIYLDRWCIAWLLDVDAVGPYTVAFTIAAGLKVVGVGFEALLPIVYASHREASTPRFVGQALELYILFATCLVALVTALNPAIFRLLIGPDFRSGQTSVPWLMLAFGLASLRLFTPGLFLNRETWRFAAINGAGASVNLVLNILLVPRVGLLGAALATTVGSLVAALLLFRANQSTYPLPLRPARYVVVGGGLVMAIASSQWLGLDTLRWLAMLATAGLAIALLLPGKLAELRSSGTEKGSVE